MSFFKAPWVAALLAVVLLQVAAKAETFNTCAGFIDSLPATITTQGVWCLRKDLTTAMTSGAAITIATNNVTIDCNGFKIGGLAAGTSSSASGVRSDRQNATVRHCAIRGFHFGIFLNGAGHRIEDNRLDQNLYAGILLSGENNRVQRNEVYDTGGYPTAYAYGIYAHADLIDNTVAGVFATSTDTFITGLQAAGGGTEVSGNRVRGLAVAGAGSATGIYSPAIGTRIAGNHVSATVSTPGYGIRASGINSFCTGNTVLNFVTAYNSCEASTGNLSLP